MSYCNCPFDDSPAFELKAKNIINDHTWSLDCLVEMVNNGNTLEDISEHIPFRKIRCHRTTKCCGVCTRRCHVRCIQDCLTRLYQWRSIYENTPEQHRKDLPLGLQMIVNQQFENSEELSWSVSEYISANTNKELRQYMEDHGVPNPNKLNYEPQPLLNSETGRPIADPVTGRFQFLDWPLSGLCPYCLPKKTIDRRYGKKYEY